MHICISGSGSIGGSSIHHSPNCVAFQGTRKPFCKPSLARLVGALAAARGNSPTSASTSTCRMILAGWYFRTLESTATGQAIEI